jgi:aconitate hydratase 2/2-methylisocitrate dehydratase
LGKLPSPEEYQQYAAQIDSMSADIYQYLNFDKMSEYTDAAKDIDTKKIAAAQLA